MERTDEPDDNGAWQEGKKPHPHPPPDPPPQPPPPVDNTTNQALQHLGSAIHVLHDETGRRFDALEHTLSMLLEGVVLLLKQGEHEVATLDDIVAEVQAETGAVNSAVVLITALHDELAAAIASNDPTKVQAVLDGLKANADALAAAVAANPDPGAAPAPTP